HLIKLTNYFYWLLSFLNFNGIGFEIPPCELTNDVILHPVFVSHTAVKQRIEQKRDVTPVNFNAAHVSVTLSS
uniref:Uncharacterized protein n=1 Tax=Aegilops tauschii subsp. strangulata TaxID=200361 RepID=A0A453HJ79_AEGTS